VGVRAFGGFTPHIILFAINFKQKTLSRFFVFFLKIIFACLYNKKIKKYFVGV